MSVEHDAIANLIGDLEPDGLVTKYVVVAEVIGTNGERAVWITAEDDAKSWDTIGLLTYAVAKETAAAVDPGLEL